MSDLDNLRFVGFENYRRLLQEPLFWKALGNTLYFVALGVPLSIGLSLGAALLVNSKLARLRSLFRTVFFAPVVTTLVAVAVVWRYIFHTRYGFLNYGLAEFGLGPIDWMGDPRWAMPAIVILAVWKNFGYNMIILLAALQNIPEDLYEAARIDGASSWQVFRHITLPGLGPVLLLVSILTMTGYFQLFAEPYVMTEGGPLQSTLSVLYFMYEEGFKWWSLGRASAVAFLLFVLMFVVTLVQLRLGREGSASVKRPGASFAVNTLLVVAAVLTAFPLFWMVSVSFMPTGAASTYPPPLLPAEPTLDNYRELFARHSAGRYMFNSALVATLATLISLVFNTMAGYAFAKLRFRGRDRLFQSLLGALVIPAQVTMIPLFAIVKGLGLVSTYGGVLVPTLASVFGIFLVRQYALSLPDELLEAARIDGASEGRIFWSLVMPLLKPILVTLAILTFLATWNDFMWPLIVLTDQKLHTLPVALAGLSREHVQDNELMMAGAVITVLPVLALFLALQRYYIAGILAGGVKG